MVGGAAGAGHRAGIPAPPWPAASSFPEGHTECPVPGLLSGRPFTVLVFHFYLFESQKDQRQRSSMCGPECLSTRPPLGLGGSSLLGGAARAQPRRGQQGALLQRAGPLQALGDPTPLGIGGIPVPQFPHSQPGCCEGQTRGRLTPPRSSQGPTWSGHGVCFSWMPSPFCTEVRINPGPYLVVVRRGGGRDVGVGWPASGNFWTTLVRG